MNKKCPQAHAQCSGECEWFMDGECAVVVIAKALSMPAKKKAVKKKEK